MMIPDRAILTEPTDEELSCMILLELEQIATAEKRAHKKQRINRVNSFSEEEHHETIANGTLKTPELVFIEFVPKIKKKAVSGQSIPITTESKVMITCNRNFAKKRNRYDHFVKHMLLI